MYSRKKWFPIAVFAFVVEIVLEALALARLLTVNMLPDNMLLVIALIMALLLIITGMLLFKGMRKKPSEARRVRRIIAMVLTGVAVVCSVMISYMTSRASDTINQITGTGDDTEVVAYVGVYTMADNAAESINDLTGETFGVMGDFDRTNTDFAISYIKDQTGSEIATDDYPSMIELAQALYNGKTKVIIMNEAYAGALLDFDQFSAFSTDTKEVLEIPVTVKNDDQETAAATEESTADSQKMKEIDEAASKSDITKTPFVMYLSGSDTREGVLVTSRSDVNLLMVVNPETKQVLLLNTPRDYYVENPAGDYAYDKLTHCGIYGIENSEKALEKLYDIDVSYYMQINFTGFEKLIDAIGGITVYSPVAFSANDINGSGYDFVEGENELNGDEALKFARERHAFASGDNARGENQMRVIKAIIDKISQKGATLLLNYDSILNSIEGMFRTDLSDEDLAALVKMQMSDGASWNVKSYAVTGESGSETTYSAPSTTAYVMYQDKDMVAKGTELVKKVLNGDKLTDDDLEVTTSDSSSEDTTLSDSSSDESDYSSTQNDYSDTYNSGYSGSTYDAGQTYNSGYSGSGYNSGYSDTTYSGYDSNNDSGYSGADGGYSDTTDSGYSGTTDSGYSDTTYSGYSGTTDSGYSGTDSGYSDGTQ